MDANQPLKLVAFGDSLTAGYGVAPGDAFPVKLEAALHARGHAVTVINAGVSGDTVENGLDRLDWSVPDDADAIIVEFGANDALRAIDPATTRTNLDAMLTKLTARKLPILLSGMRAPHNWGSAYADAYDPMFAELARKYNAILDPFFLDGVILKPTLNQADGVHPTAQGVDVIVARLLPAVEALLARAAAKS